MYSIRQPCKKLYPARQRKDAMNMHQTVLACLSSLGMESDTASWCGIGHASKGMLHTAQDLALDVLTFTSATWYKNRSGSFLMSELFRIDMKIWEGRFKKAISIPASEKVGKKRPQYLHSSIQHSRAAKWVMPVYAGREELRHQRRERRCPQRKSGTKLQSHGVHFAF